MSAQIELTKQAFAAVEANDVETYVSLFTEDAVYKIANFDAVVGPDGIRAFAKPVMDMFSKVTHDVRNMWEIGDRVVCEMTVTYVRNDGKEVTVPCLDIIQFRGDKVCKLQAFIDASPAFS